MESRTSTVVESKTRLTSKRNFVLDSTTFLNFRVPDSTKSSKIACLCTVMFALAKRFQFPNGTLLRSGFPPHGGMKGREGGGLVSEENKGSKPIF